MSREIFRQKDLRKTLQGIIPIYISIATESELIYTYVSHGKSGEDVGDDIVKSMKRQLGLATAKQVRELVGCTMDGAQYLSALLASGALATEVPKGPTPAPSKKGNR